MIPILGIPILNRPELLWRMLRSIDVAVGEIVVIDNGDCIHEVPEGVPDFTHVWPGYNMGVAASWNHVVKMRPRAPWWAIFNFDLTMAEGDCQRLEDEMERTGGLVLLAGMSAFGIDRATVRQAGFFDENFVPAYFEDDDYKHRARMAGVTVTSLPWGAAHEISATMRASDELRRRNEYTFPLNREYFRQKWGGSPYREVFTTPHDGGGSVRDWTLSIDRLADQSWDPE